MSRSRTKPKKMKKKTNPTENRSAIEPNRIVATMDDLPELPFEKVLSYLSLEDRLKSRAVSRRWYVVINSFKAKTLCYSKYPAGFILRKSRWVSGAFAKNFISSPRFSSFFNTFGPTILSNLKHLRICDLHLNAQDNGTSTFVPTLNMFGRLEELDLIRFTCPSAASGPDGEFELNLSMLANIHLERVNGIDQLSLDAPKLKRVKLLECSSSLRLELVHTDSVEWLATDQLEHLPAKNLKSLKYLHCGLYTKIDATFLSGLEQLKEVHTLKRVEASELFEQKRRYGRTDLKIFLIGLLLNGPDDPFSRFENFNPTIVHLAKNLSKLAAEIPLWIALPYSALDGVAPEVAINLYNRFTDLDAILIMSSIPSQGVHCFLNLLKNIPHNVDFKFSGDQPQDLFDRLPEHSDVQSLHIDNAVSDFRFLYRLEHLISLQYSHKITAEVIRKAFEELHFLWTLQFKHRNKLVQIVRDPLNRWMVSTGEKKTNVADLNAAIQLVFGQRQKKRNKRR